MAGLLDPGLATEIYASFRGQLRGGVIRRAVPASNTGDAYGDAAGPPVYQTWSIEGFTEGYSRYTAAQAGIPATDLKLNVFAASAPGLEPAKDDQARLDVKSGGRVTSSWYQVRGPVSTDPAKVMWACQVFEIPEPAA